jgi:hypothetical protein
LTLDGKLAAMVKDTVLGRPNGIAVSGDSVWVVSFGSGELYRVTPGSGNGRSDVIKLPQGTLDGLLVLNGEIFATSWEGQAVYRGLPGGPFREVLGNLPAPADLGHDAWRHRLLIPLFNDNEIRIVPLTPW